MTRSFAEQLTFERERYAALAGGAIAAPLAGALYWGALGALGFRLPPSIWCLAAFFASALIFPLALLLQRPTGSSLSVKDNPLTRASLVGLVNLAPGWAVTIPAYHTDPQLVPLTLGIGMSLHVASVGWSFSSPALIVHPLLRAAAIVALWYGWPGARFTAIPLAIAALHVLTALLLRREVSEIGARHRAAAKLHRGGTQSVTPGKYMINN